MPISINNSIQKREQYQNEKELQEIIFTSPYILCNDTDGTLFMVKRELFLKSAGILDMFMIDSYGTPVAVEVKLARNAQSRREVVAQAFDYASDLSQMTIDELNIQVDGAIEELLEGDDLVEKGLWKALAANLRAGILRIIIAIDEANEDLIRIVRYMNDHSDLDVRLVEISKYNNASVIIPNIIVMGKQDGNDEPKISLSKTNDQLVKIIDEYKKLNLPYIVRPGGRNYKAIDVEGWPKEIHYEYLMQSNDAVTVDIHFEKAAYKTFTAKIVDKLQNKLETKEVVLDQKWARNCGRVYIQVDVNNQIGCAQTMKALMGATKNYIDELLGELQTTKS